MSLPTRVLLLIALVVLVSCAVKPPLPAGGPPADFLFILTEEGPATETTPSPGNSAPDTSLTRVRVTLDATGQIDVEATYLQPYLIVQKSSLTLPSEQLSSLYELIRQADIYPMQDHWEGSDRQIGRKTYFVLGQARSKTVSVEGTTVPALARILSEMLSFVPSRRPPPSAEQTRVVMDTRTNTFHTFKDPHVEAIPLGFRKVYPHRWAALDDGGIPCPSFEDSGD